MDGSPRCVGRVAIVTGASRGIGRAIAERLASEGASVAITARTLAPDPRYDGSLEETAASIRAGGGVALPIEADLSHPDDRARIVATVVAQLGPVDVLVNNAAVTFMQPFASFPTKRLDLMFEVQLRAAVHLSQLVVPSMQARRTGWILNISSRAAIHPEGPPFDRIHEQGMVAYSIVKAALDRFSTALAAELHRDRVVVNSLAPWDIVATPGAAAHDLVDGAAIEGPEWMAEAALALCTGDPDDLTGRVAYSQQLLAELGVRPRSPMG